MKRVVVGTAGHIDHGKTKLVEALTGIDCDRWSEEKERGITIDLGFAHLEEGDLRLGFVDVPGHERFLHNALAGLGGIRIVLLVVAADEGVKPQTREHLAICSLLGIPACVVALTKRDLVSPELLELASLEVEELLAETLFEGSAIVPVSAATGEGVVGLGERLVDLGRQQAAPRDPHLLTRLPVDRAFQLKGLGPVVTGTLVSGAVEAAASLNLLPGGDTARVRSVQVHGRNVRRAEAGERTALQITGVDAVAVRRGMELVEGDLFRPTRRLLSSYHHLADAPKALRGSTPVRFHLYAAEVMGRIRPLAGPLRPGDEGAVEIALAEPVVALRGDRYVVRRPSPPSTLGGGGVLDPRWRPRRGDVLHAALEALSGPLPPALRHWIRETGEAGLEASELTARLGWGEERVAKELAALADQGLVRIPAGQGHGERWLEAAAFRRVKRRARAFLDRYFRDNRLAEDVPKAEALTRILPGRAAELAGVYLPWLESEKVLALRGDRITRPGRSADLTEVESALATKLVHAFEEGGLAPPSPADLGRSLGAKPQILEGVLGYLLRQKKLTRLPGGLLLATSAVDRVVHDLRTSNLTRLTVPDFKTRHHLTRKWAIPLLEHLDSLGVTRRVGNERIVLAGPPPPSS